MRSWSFHALMGLGLSVFCVLLGIWTIDWPGAIHELSGVRVAWLWFGLLAACVSFACFAMRWQALMANLLPLSFRHALGYFMIGYMVNAVLPMRTGDLLRAALV